VTNKDRIARWVTPLSYILGTSIVALLGLWLLSGHTTKRLDLVGTCSEVTLPSSQHLLLPNFDSIHLRGFDGSLSNMRSFELRTPASDDVWTAQANVLKLEMNPERAADEQPSLELTTKGAQGLETFVVFPAGTSIKGGVVNPDFGPILTAELPDKDEGEINVKAEEISLPEVNRMRVSGNDAPAWIKASETFSFVSVPNRSQLINAHFNVIRGSSNRRPQVNLRFSKASAVPELYKVQDSSDAKLNHSQLMLTKCDSPVIKLNEQDAGRQPKQIAYDIVLSAPVLQLTSLRLVPADSQQDQASASWRLRIALAGTVTSAKVGETELVPTLLEDAFSGSLTQTGGIGLGLILAVFGMALLLRRAYESLFALLMPRPLEEGGMHVDKQYNFNTTGHGNIFNVADFMTDVTNTVNQNVNQSEQSDELKETVKKLAEQVALIGTKIDPEIAEQMGSDVKALSDELTKSKPRRAWYEVTLTGLKEAAEAVGEVGKPIIETVLKLMPLLLS
jgi:hypothetical protein